MENITVVQVVEFLKILIYLGGILLAIYKIPFKISKVLKSTIEEEIKPLSKQIDDNEKDRLRFEILSFAGDLRNNIVKTRQEFETIFAYYDKYEKIVEKLKLHNGYLDTEFDYIKLKYIDLETEDK